MEPAEHVQRSSGGDASSAGPSVFFNPVMVDLPEKLDFRDPHDWRRWISRWERYRIISGLHLRDQEAQVNTFIYAVGREAEDVLLALRLTDEELKTYDTVRSKFESHFVPRRNIIYERGKFNMRKQEPHETADTFITDLHKLADTCDYGSLKEDLIRDRIVVGLLDKSLSEKLQLDSKLTLQGAIMAARNSETVQRQQTELRSQDALKTDVEEVKRKSSHHTAQPRRRCNSPKGAALQPSGFCGSCGMLQQHTKQHCPAAGKRCRACNKVGHFESVCRSKQSSARQTRTRTTYESSGKLHLQEVSLGEVLNSANGQPWYIDAMVGTKMVTFKVDTGADVTVIPATEYSR